MLEISLDEARSIAVAAQGLDRRPRGRITKQTILDTIRRIGCVQLDTISVVARSHETVLWSRLGPYDPALVEELHYPDGAVIEYWAHAAAITPVESFPYFRRTMARYAAPESSYAHWRRENAEIVDHVLDSIRERGPLGSRHFQRSNGRKPEPWSWYGENPVRQALEFLWTTGELAVLRRIGFQRLYDLTERVLPGARDADMPSMEEQRRYFVTLALSALGIATPRWVADYFRTGGRAHVSTADAAAELKAMGAEGLAVPVEVSGFPGKAWLDPAQASRLGALSRPSLTTLLSPFDNLIWYRPRTQALFGFDYRLEIYTPAPKRLYGYYTLAILHRGKLVGRLDPSYSRKDRILTIKSVHLEQGVRPTESLASAIAGSLNDYLRFLGGEEIAILCSNPEVFAPLLQAAVDKSLG